MSSMKMKSVNTVRHVVNGVIFVVNLTDFTDDKVIVIFILTKDDKQIC